MRVMRLVVGLLITLALIGSAAWAQNFAPESAVPFRVTWGAMNGVSPIEGYVYNDSPYWVGNVRLRIEGLDGAQRTIGERYVWTPADVPPSNRIYFTADRLPGAASYRISVASYDLRTGGGP